LRARRLIAPLVIAGLTAVAIPSTADAAAQLRVSSASEPPDRVIPRGSFTVTATVANEGDRRGRAGQLRFYLTSNRRLAATDIRRRLTGSVRYGRLAAGRQSTRVATVRLPASVTGGSFLLVACASTPRARSTNPGCRVSGQALAVGGSNVGGTGPTGPRGPAGERGPKGDPGTSPIRIARTTLDTGIANISDQETVPHAVPPDPTTDLLATEGSTQMVDLAKVGPFTFKGLCREGMVSETLADERRRDEAKILVYHDATGQTMVMRGIHGSRANVPAGSGTAGFDNALGGEGQHQMLATYRQEDEGFSTKLTDAPFVPDGTGNGQGDTNAAPDPARGPEDEFVSGFIAGSTFIALSGGYEVQVLGYAGIDVLGFGTRDNEQTQYPDADGPDKVGEDDRCVFGGQINVINVPG